MVSTIKTLIIFDTNALRNVLKLTKRNGKMEDTVVYHSFEFGLPFRTVESFINNNGLSDFVELAIPKIAFDELKKQKLRSYFSDFKIFSEIQTLLTKLPYANKDKIVIPDTGFNYQQHIEEKATKYLSTKKIRVIEIPDNEHLKDVFQRIINRALNTKPPFQKHGDRSDVGFKDALIWESILSYPHIGDFDKVILFTNDNCFSGECEKEFQDKFQKYFSIQKSEGDVEEELAKDYVEYIENRELIKYTNSDYFKSHLEQELSGKSLRLGATVYPIVRYEILDPSETIEHLQESEQQTEDYEEISINSKLKVIYTKNGSELELILLVSTIIDSVKNIVDVHFDPDVIEQ